MVTRQWCLVSKFKYMQIEFNRIIKHHDDRVVGSYLPSKESCYQYTNLDKTSCFFLSITQRNIKTPALQRGKLILSS